MYCRECGHELREDSKFCVKCGTKVVPEMENKSMVSSTNNANNNVTQSIKSSQKSWYEEIGAIGSQVNKYSGNSGNERNIYLFMTIALIWLALSCFMPLVDVLYGEYSFFDLGDLLDGLEYLGVKVGFYKFIAFLGKISYVIGIVLLIYYVWELLKPKKNKVEIGDAAFMATIALSIPTVVVIIEKIFVNNKSSELGVRLVSLTVFTWITLIVMVVNILVLQEFSKTHYSNKGYVDNNTYKNKICMQCRTRYSASSCPICGSSSIVK